MLSYLTSGGCRLPFYLFAVVLPLVSPHNLNRHQEQGDKDRPKLLLVSFDGFRWDYIYRVPTPNFRSIMDEGVKVEFVENIYITKTYPNHYSMVTGLYAETHGVVANEMYDPALNLSFSMETDSVYDSRWWEQAVPLWVTVQKDGGRSGAAMWPGSDVLIHGVFPTRYLPYNASVSFEARVRSIIEWFSAPEGEAVDFGILYWEEPDESGHNLGPQSPLMDSIIAGIDEKLGFLLDELKKAGRQPWEHQWLLNIQLTQLLLAWGFSFLVSVQITNVLNDGYRLQTLTQGSLLLFSAWRRVRSCSTLPSGR